MEKKRVLLVSCGGLGNGGVQAILMGIVRSLSTQFVFDVLLFTSEKRHYDEEFLSYGGRIFRIPHYEGESKLLGAVDMYIRDLYIYRRLLRILLKEDRYDAIHCHKEAESAPILKAAFKVDIPVRVCHSHIINKPYNKVMDLLNDYRRKLIIRYATHLIGCSYESCLSLYGLDANSRVINNFYDDNKFSLGINHCMELNPPYVITQVGAISRIKNQAFSIQIIKELRDRGIEAKLQLVGFDMDLSYKDYVQKIIKEKEIGDFVCFLPGNSCVPEVLKSSSLFLMPSLREGFGIALIEAQAMALHCFASKGVPVSTDCGGVTYLDLSEGVATWVNKIEEYLNNTRMKRRLQTDAFKMSEVTGVYHNIYDGII